MKKGGARALRLLDTEEAALAWACGKGVAGKTIVNGKDVTQIDSTHQIEFRPGERKRCAGYCSVMPFCEQFKEWEAANEARADA